MENKVLNETSKVLLAVTHHHPAEKYRVIHSRTAAQCKYNELQSLH